MIRKRTHKAYDGQRGAVILGRLGLLIFLAGATTVGLQDSLSKLPTPPRSTDPVAETVVSYVCPMHPEQHAARPGRCPVCHMQLQSVSKVDGITVGAGAAAEPGWRLPLCVQAG